MTRRKGKISIKVKASIQEELVTEEMWIEIKNGVMGNDEISNIENSELNLEFKARRMALNFLVNIIMAVKESPTENLNLQKLGDILRQEGTVLSKIFKCALLNSFDFYTQRVFGLIGAEKKADIDDENSEF